ncbi:MAG: hypothetical protein IPG31_00770 [Nitrosomonas sp.]|nr:hypothetical protein [Nitrosomonas sp.]
MRIIGSLADVLNSPQHTDTCKARYDTFVDPVDNNNRVNYALRERESLGQARPKCLEGHRQTREIIHG